MIFEQKSLKGSYWEVIDTDQNYKMEIKQKYNLPEICCQLIAQRIKNIEDVELFIKPKIKHSMKDPFILKDMHKSVLRIVKAFKSNEKISIFGDYDVDGATSSSILKKFFDSIGIKNEIYIPDRILEGYGPNTEALQQLKDNGANIVITVDCGTVAFEPLEQAQKFGLDVIVVDHHISAKDIPLAIGVINPNRLDEDYGYQYLAGVGVTFLLIVAINSQLKKENLYNTHNIAEPNLLELLDLVALGTICDVVPIVGLNRAFVSTGLKIMQSSKNIGLKSLISTSNLHIDEISTYHLGFILGPKINAGGRIGNASLGAKLLTNDSFQNSNNISQELTKLNDERKAIELISLEEAYLQLKKNPDQSASIIITSSKNWHPGVIGIMASRIKDKYNLPTIIISINDDDLHGKASCRSIPGVNIGGLIAQAKQEKIIIDGGGHEMAAGFSIEMNKLSQLQSFLEAEASPIILESQKKNSYKINHILSVDGLSIQLIKDLETLSPFGMGNPTPKIMIKECYIIKPKIIGLYHISFFIKQKILGANSKSIKAIMWRVVDTEIGNLIFRSAETKAPISIVGTININKWQNREEVNFYVDDISNIVI